MPPRREYNRFRGTTNIDLQSFLNIDIWAAEDYPILQYHPNNRNPLDILEWAFREYIVSYNIESSTLGIEVHYLENGVKKTLLLVKRNYDGNQQKVQVNYEQRPSDIIIDNGSTLNNDQIRQVINTVRNFDHILQINLCEIYNDDPDYRTRREYSPGYYPFIVPIRLLYRNIPEHIAREYRELQNQRLRIHELRTNTQDYDLEQQIDDLARELEHEMDQRIYQQTPQAQESHRRRIAELQGRIDQLELRNDELVAEEITRRHAQDDQPARDLQRRLIAGEVPPEELFEQFRESLPVDRPSEHNPDPIEIVNNQRILNLPITSNVWPGQCIMCLESNRDNLCRVNCPQGHIFHCDCLNEYRDTYTVFGWNNNCPSCREPIDQAVHVPVDIKLPTEFGKRKRSSKLGLEHRMSYAHSFNPRLLHSTLKTINKEIKYLSK